MYSPNETQQYLLKVTIVGDMGSGKTALLNRFIADKFFENSPSTIGADYKIKYIDVELKNKKKSTFEKIKLLLWDCSGRECFITATTSYYNQSHAFIVCIDLTERNFFAAIGSWFERIRARMNGIPILLVGTKNDLSSENKITQDELIQTAIDYQCAGYFITSAKKNTSIEEIFSKIIELNRNNIKIFSHEKELKQKEKSIWHQNKRKIIIGSMIGAFVVASITLSMVLPVTVPFLLSIGLIIPFTGPAAMAALAGIGAAVGLVAGSVVAGITFGIEALIRRFHRIEKINAQSEVEKDRLTKFTKLTSVGQIAQALGSSSNNLLRENNEARELTNRLSENRVGISWCKTVHNTSESNSKEISITNSQTSASFAVN